ncbi:MAG: ABATE domain-containing protein [Thermoanaerobaculia bacterium]
MAKRKPLTRLQKLLRSDGALCVTFVNTTSPKRKAIESYDDLLAWGVDAGALAAAESERLASGAAVHPGNAASAVRRALTLRRRLRRILLALAGGGRPAPADLGLFNSDLGRAMATRQVVATGSGYRWSWGDAGGDDLHRMLWPVLRSAADLLTSRYRERVGQCPDEDCGLLFIAHNSGRPRKWCGVACRNRNASQKHYRLRGKSKRARKKLWERGEP